MLSPEQVAAKWLRNIQSASQSITDGVNAMTVNPMELAAQAVDRQVQGVQRAAASGKTAASLRAVTVQSYKDAMIKKGIPRIGPGAQQALPKEVAFLSKLLPYQTQLKQQLASMPRGDENANRARMNAWFDGMKQFSKTR